MISRFLNCLFLTIVLSLVVSSHECHAQRTAERSYFITVSPGLTIGGIPSASGEISFGQYLMRSYWDASVKVSHWNHLLTSDGSEYFDQVAWHAGMGLMYRLVSTYSRFFNMYIGGRVFLGLAQYQVFHKAPQHRPVSTPESKFIYGAEPAIEFEFFLGQRFALVCEGHAPLTFGHTNILKSDWYNFTASVGLRYNF